MGRSHREAYTAAGAQLQTHMDMEVGPWPEPQPGIPRTSFQLALSFLGTAASALHFHLQFGGLGEVRQPHSSGRVCAHSFRPSVEFPQGLCLAWRMLREARQLDHPPPFTQAPFLSY